VKASGTVVGSRQFHKKSKTKRAQKRLDAAAFFLYSFRSEFNSRDTLTHTISQPLNHTLTFSHQIYRKPENIYKKEKNNKKSVFFLNQARENSNDELE
jgi:hypothetical protein